VIDDEMDECLNIRKSVLEVKKASFANKTPDENINSY